jgi:GAF domain-containing protein
MESAVELLGVDGIGLMLLDDTERLRAAGFTNGPASVLEQVQVELGLGPGIDASRRAESIAVDDLAEAPDYAGLWRRTARTGIRAVLASPIRVSGTVVGNLNAVRDRAHHWSFDEIRANEAYARVVGVTLDLAVAELDGRSRPDGREAGR